MLPPEVLSEELPNEVSDKPIPMQGSRRCTRDLVPELQSNNLSVLRLQWFCPMMNKHDKRMQWTCQIAEKDQAWYDEYFLHPNEPPAEGAAPFTATHVTSANLSQDQVEKLVARDPILTSLLGVRVGARKPHSIISKHIFHDVLLDEATYPVPNSPAAIPDAATAPPHAMHDEEASSTKVAVFEDIPLVAANGTNRMIDTLVRNFDDDESCMGESV